MYIYMPEMSTLNYNLCHKTIATPNKVDSIPINSC